MSQKSYWIAQYRNSVFPKLQENLKVDVVVVGGGITGITAAYLLKKAGKTVALVERDRCGMGDTAHTTAHLTHVTDLRLSHLIAQLGENHAQAVWDAGRAAMAQIEENVNEENIACDLMRVPGHLHTSLKGSNGDERASFQEEARRAEALSFSATYTESIPLFACPGIRFPLQAKFRPLQYLAGLLATIPGGGSHVFEETNVDEFSADPLQVKSGAYSIQCDYVVIATHVPLMGIKNLVSSTLFQTKLAAHSTYALAAEVPAGKYPEALFWDTSDPYYYLRIDRDGSSDIAIFGGEDHKTGQNPDTEMCFAALSGILASHLPDAKVRYRWSGQVIGTYDWLPLIGEMSRKQFVATGYGGNGMTFGTLGGMMACDAALGRKNPWSALFDVHRKTIGGAWDYIKENSDYPYYMARGQIAESEGTSVEDVAPGEGKILSLEGKKVAAYRSQNGAVSLVSCHCTHMGCIVKWNNAERTWDCPCHGSRFKPNGEVVAGPAEKPLDRALWPQREPANA